MNNAQLMLLVFTVWGLTGWAWWATLCLVRTFTSPVKAYGGLMVSMVFGAVALCSAFYFFTLAYQSVRYMFS